MARRTRQRDDAVAGLLGGAAGVAVVVLGARPTGAATVDIVVTAAAAGFVGWAAARLPWWVYGLAAAVATGLASSVWGALAGLAAVGFALAARRHLMRAATARALSLAALLFALAHLRDIVWWGTSAVAATSIALAIAVAGVMARRPDERRIGLTCLAAAAGLMALGALGLVVGGLAARDDLRAGDDAARRGLQLVRSGEFPAARREFSTAAVRFRSADLGLRAPWTQLARLVPIAAQHRAAGSDVANAAAAASRTIEAELRAVDLEALRVVDGRIDVDAVRALEAPLDRVTGAVGRLDATVASADDGWLIGRARDRLDRLRSDLAEQLELGRKAGNALEVAPDMLGADGVRRYLVMFTTPAEARGLGGFMGNYAELTFDDGRIEMTAFGRHGDLSEAAQARATITDVSPDWLARYGPFGFATGPNGTVGDAAWANITMSPHFPSTASVAAELYPQSGGRPVDGVVALDVFALEALVGLVGPIAVDGATAPLDGATTASFLLIDQYRIDDVDARVDLLETVAREAVDRLLDGAPPDPLDIGRALRPMADERRLVAWSSHPAEQAMLAEAGLDGSLLGGLDPGREHGIAVTVNNASGNKIDTFLRRDYELRETGDGEVELTIVLRNEPPLELPDYVVGNLVGLPRGWSRLYVTVHTDLELAASRGPFGPIGLQRSEERGLNAYSTFAEIGPGTALDITLRLRAIGSHRSVLVQPQPLASTERWMDEPIATSTVLSPR